MRDARPWLLAAPLLAASVGLASCGGESGPSPPPDYVFDTWVYWVYHNTVDSLVRPNSTIGGKLTIEGGDYDPSTHTWSGDIALERETYAYQGVDERVYDRFGDPLAERAGRVYFEGTWTWVAEADNVHLESSLACVDLEIENERPDVQAWTCEDFEDISIYCRARNAERLIRCGIDRGGEGYFEPEGAR